MQRLLGGLAGDRHDSTRCGLAVGPGQGQFRNWFDPEVESQSPEKETTMPYGKRSDRPRLDAGGEPAGPGDLNYAITRIIDAYLARRGMNYANLNEAIGVLECAKLELYRRIVAGYEDRKIADAENGDVYTVRP